MADASSHIEIFKQKSKFIYSGHIYSSSSGPLLLRGVTGQNDSGQNGTDKMVWTKWYTDKMVLDKMVWTKWYGQNGMDKMVYGQNDIGQNGIDKMVRTKW